MTDRIFDARDVMRAANLAAERHHGQMRSGAANEPYLFHVLEVAELVAEATEGDEKLVIAALLHDVVEDTDTTVEEIEAQFGAAAASIVAELTDDPNLTKVQQKEAQLASMPHKSHEARIVKIADKLSNTRSLYIKPPNWRRSSIVGYALGNRAIVDAGRGTNLYLEDLWDEMWRELTAALELDMAAK